MAKLSQTPIDHDEHFLRDVLDVDARTAQARRPPGDGLRVCLVYVIEVLRFAPTIPAWVCPAWVCPPCVWIGRRDRHVPPFVSRGRERFHGCQQKSAPRASSPSNRGSAACAACPVTSTFCGRSQVSSAIPSHGLIDPRGSSARARASTPTSTLRVVRSVL